MTGVHLSRAAATEATEKLKVFAQPQRLMILSCLVDGERTVGEIDEITRISQPALSQQLAALRRAGLVLTRRIAKQVYYRIADNRAASCIRNIEKMFGNDRDVITVLPESAPAPPPPTADPKPPAGAAGFARIL